MSGSDISGYASGACPTSRSVCVNTTSPKRRSTCSRVREKDFGTRPGLMSGSWPGRSEKSRTVLDAKHGAGLDGPKIACSNSLSGVRVSHAWRKTDTPYEGSEWPKPAKHGNIIGIVTATDEPLSGPAAAGRAVGLRGSGEAAGGEHGPRLGGSVNSRPRYVVTKPAGWCDHIGVSCPVRRRPLHAHGKASERSCALSRQLADRHTGLTTRKRGARSPDGLQVAGGSSIGAPIRCKVSLLLALTLLVGRWRIDAAEDGLDRPHRTHRAREKPQAARGACHGQSTPTRLVRE